ncbi:hypothetical protein PREVCOP_05017 [Segatella copri DSM 18205]|uniref:Uncharacterized protein n=1 Tax=Segatella copri DSM 18205 TaxID=537011 RepID=D1PCT2_9BACT|nr:hypothetical protein PREVCOP_05017 [Segatella copri DSM 18205]
MRFSEKGFHTVPSAACSCSSPCEPEWYKTPSYCSISPVYLSISDEIQKNIRKLFG